MLSAWHLSSEDDQGRRERGRASSSLFACLLDCENAWRLSLPRGGSPWAISWSSLLKLILMSLKGSRGWQPRKSWALTSAQLHRT